MRYEILDQGAVVSAIEADAQFMAAHYAAGAYRLAAQQATATPDLRAWLVTVGAFFDRFGPAKIAVLSSGNAVVQALVRDASVREFIDLQRADVAQGLDAIIAAPVAGVDATLKAAILTTPTTAAERYKGTL